MFQNIHAPLSLGMHITFCILANIIYLIQYSRKGYAYYLYLILAVSLTIFTQFVESNESLLIIGIGEAILIGLAVYSRIVIGREEKKAIAEQNKEQIEAEKIAIEDELKNREIIENAFDDEIDI